VKKKGCESANLFASASNLTYAIAILQIYYQSRNNESYHVVAGKVLYGEGIMHKIANWFKLKLSATTVEKPMFIDDHHNLRIFD